MLDYGWPNANPNVNVNANANANANANPPLLDPYADFSQFSYPAFYDSFLNLEPNGVMLMPKTEPDFNTRLGLNLGLGGRTYFASSEDDFLTRRSRILDPNSVRCQAEGCNADLTHAKHYHRRHKVCEFHSKAATVIAAGLTQRFCQQCSRFHLLSEFDNGKRSCRKRLADHNRRRRKSHQDNNIKIDDNPPSENLQRDSSSVTVAVSPPPMISLSYIHGGSTTTSFN